MHVSPLTFTLVLIISSNLSTPNKSVMPSSGMPSSVKIKDNIMIPALGIPAVPIEATVAVSIITLKSTSSSSMP